MPIGLPTGKQADYGIDTAEKTYIYKEINQIKT